MRLRAAAVWVVLLSSFVIAGPASAAVVTNYATEADFLAAADPSMQLIFENFDAFGDGEIVINQINGVTLSSPYTGQPAFVPVRAESVPQSVSGSNILSGGYIDGSPLQQTIVLDFHAPSSALSFYLAAQHPTAMDVSLDLDFSDGSARTVTVMDQDGNNNPVEFFGITTDVPIVRATLRSGDEAGGLFQNFGGIDDLRFGIVDEISPICSGNPSELAGMLGIDGTATDDRLGDTGIASIALSPDSVNLVLDIDPGFMAGDAAVSYRVEQAVAALGAEGTVIVTDGAGNTCELCINFKVLPEGPTFAEVLCCVEGIVFQISNDDLTPPGAAVCSAAEFSIDQPRLPFGFEPSPEEDPIPCQVFTINSPVFGPTEMVMKKDGDFDPRLRLCFSRSEDGGLTYPPFEDVTELVEPILDVDPDPTRIKGKKGWSPVKVACCLLAELCNGIDDDGDGLVDEGLPINDDTVDEDSDGYFLCPPLGLAADCNDQNPSVNPAGTEVCNGMDDDCNGTFDEDNPGGDLPCEVEGELGVCAEGLTDCIEATIECTQVNDPVAESCDGLDNDCDGTDDNGFALGLECSNGIGECAASGLTVCSADGSDTDCDAVPGDPVAESCDGLDNDCDGSADNGFGLGAACSVGEGECSASGTLVCSTDGSMAVCDAQAGKPETEVCDGLDNDCDGDVDENDRQFGGYEQPVNADGTSIFNGKSVIPFKFRLTDCGGNAIQTTSPPTISVLFYMNGIVGTEVETVKGAGKANDGNEYRFNKKENKYIFNMSAKTLLPNNSYIVRTTLDDGSTHDVIISIN